MARLLTFIFAVAVSVVFSFWLSWLVPYPASIAFSLPFVSVIAIFFCGTPTSAWWWLAGLGFGLDVFTVPVPAFQLIQFTVGWIVLYLVDAHLHGAPWWWRVALGTMAAAAALSIMRMVQASIPFASSPPLHAWSMFAVSLLLHAGGMLVLVKGMHTVRAHIRISSRSTS